MKSLLLILTLTSLPANACLVAQRTEDIFMALRIALKLSHLPEAIVMNYSRVPSIKESKSLSRGINLIMASNYKLESIIFSNFGANLEVMMTYKDVNQKTTIYQQVTVPQRKVLAARYAELMEPDNSDQVIYQLPKACLQ